MDADRPDRPARTHAIVVEAEASTAPWTRLFSLETFRYARTGWWIDAALPHGPRAYLAFALLAPVALWGLGYATAPDPSAYLDTPDVTGQIPFLAIHLLALRMVASLFARGTTPALNGLGVPTPLTDRFRRGLVGPLANLGALAAAAWWIYRDASLSLVAGESGLTAFDDPDQWDMAALGHPHQHALLALWIVEWVIFGVILWVQLWTMLGLARTIRRTDFRPHLERIMIRDEYRDFFALIAKNATVCAGFALANLAFVAYTGELVPKPERVVSNAAEFFAEMSDLTSVGFLFLVIIAGYVSYVFLIRRALTKAIDSAYAPVADAVLEAASTPLELAGRSTAEALDALRARLDGTLALVRALTFQREVDALGGRGLTTILLKALPVLGTIALRVYKMITLAS